ncbi:MAG: sensor domain-containing diguanylate cyclase [Candidatus Cloacimonadia bacterium]
MELKKLLFFTKDDELLKRVALTFQESDGLQPKIIQVTDLKEIEQFDSNAGVQLFIIDYQSLANNKSKELEYLDKQCERFKSPFIFLSNDVKEVSLTESKRLVKIGVVLSKSFTSEKLATAVKLAFNRCFCYRERVELDVRDLITANSDLLVSSNAVINIFNSVNEGVWKWKVEENSLTVSDKFCDLLGFKSQSIPKDFNSFVSLIHAEDKVKFRTMINEYIKNMEDALSIEVRVKDVAGAYKWYMFKGYSELNTKGEVDTIIGIIIDINFLKMEIEKYQNKALYDTLTKLPNRELLYDRLRGAIANADRSEIKLGLLFIDVNKFKVINDEHGHTVGDLVLIETAKRIVKAVRKVDTVARFSGDEFVVILPNIASLDNIHTIIKRIREVYEKPMKFQNIVLNVTCSIGYSSYPKDANNIEELINIADMSMYEDKKRLGATR